MGECSESRISSSFLAPYPSCMCVYIIKRNYIAHAIIEGLLGGRPINEDLEMTNLLTSLKRAYVEAVSKMKVEKNAPFLQEAVEGPYVPAAVLEAMRALGGE